MSHYNSDYFEWQKQIGMIGGYLNKFKFEKHVKEDDVLMDFGCGGGYLLANFNNNIKYGFEINKAAWDECQKNNITVFDNFDKIENESIDTIISNHALEHVPLPLVSLQNLYKKLKKNGKLIIVIPCEQIGETGFHYKPNDINQHLHTWCPMTFGNLVTLAGFKVETCDVLQHKWCPDYKTSYRHENFHQRCIEYAKKTNNVQIKLVAYKE